MMKGRSGVTMTVSLTFVVVFAVMLMAYIYLMQKTWVVYRKMAYLKKDVMMSALDLAIYDISRGRHKGGANYNPVFYAKEWQADCGSNCYSVVYKIPKKVSPGTGVPCNDSRAKLQGSNCFSLDNSSIDESIEVEVEYKSVSGNWQILVKEPKI